MKTLNQVRCVELDIHIWSARKKLQLSDLKNISDREIPPDKLASLGSKIICDPDELKVFKRLKKRALRSCESVGARFLGGYAIPVKRLDDVVNELTAIQNEFNAATHTFLASYEQNIEKWIQENHEWEAMLRRSVTPLKVVQSRMGFDFHVFCVSEAVEDEDNLVNQNLRQHASSLGNTLFKEVARDANTLWEKSFSGRDQITRRALGSIEKLKAKLNGFVVVDPRVMPVVSKIDSVINALPQTGNLDKNHFHALESLVLLLRDSSKLREYGEATLTHATQKPDASPAEKTSLPADDDNGAHVGMTPPPADTNRTSTETTRWAF